METRLDLTFVTSEGKTYRLSIDNPKIGLSDATVQSVMDQIIASNVIKTKNGTLATIKGARYVDTVVSELAVA